MKLENWVADDVKLYCAFDVDVSNCGDLQLSIDLLSSWANSWQLCINISKCSVLSIHHNSKDSIHHPYYINGMQLSNTSSVTDLGIVVDSRLSFNLHLSNILAKATQRVGVFFRGFSSRHPELMRKAFITYIRPSLECNSNIWNPTKKYLIDKLENIQRPFHQESSITLVLILLRASKCTQFRTSWAETPWNLTWSNIIKSFTISHVLNPLPTSNSIIHHLRLATQLLSFKNHLTLTIV